MRTLLTGSASGADWNAFYDHIGSVRHHKRIPDIKEQIKKVADANGDGKVEKDDVVALLQRTNSTGPSEALTETQARQLADRIFAGKQDLTAEDVQKALSIQKNAQAENRQAKQAEAEAKTGFPRFEKPCGGCNQQVNILV